MNDTQGPNQLYLTLPQYFIKFFLTGYDEVRFLQISFVLSCNITLMQCENINAV